jgi:RNA polymerase sigma factor (sigma-70 family)
MPLASNTHDTGVSQCTGAKLLGEGRATVRIGALYERHGDELRRFLGSYLRNRNDIDDCIQETFFNIWRQEIRGALREDTRGYLFTTAMNVARDIYRRGRARKETQQEPLSEYIESIRSTVDTYRRARNGEGASAFANRSG